MNKLLLRQIKKHFGAIDHLPDALKGIMQDIENTYKNYEDDNKLLQNSIEISSQELSDAFLKQKQYAEAQKETINKIIAAINAINPSGQSGMNENETAPYDSSYLFDSLIKLIEERKQAEEALRQSEFRMISLTSTAQDAILMMDAEGQVSYWNAAAERIFGYSSDEAIGRILHDFIVPRRFREAHQTAFPGFLLTGQGAAVGKTSDLMALRKDGKEISVQLSLSSFKLKDVWHAVGILRDITEQKMAAEALQRAKEQAEAANRAKSEFLANMSHEIRTPMNGVIGMSDLMAGTSLDEEQRLIMNAISTSADHLMGIINNILDFSKIEADKMELIKSPFLLRPFIGNTLRAMAGKAAEKGLELTVQIDPAVPDALEGDPGRLSQILLNLLSNALKFSESGEIRSTVQLESRDGTKLLVRFSICDQGIGIPESQRGMIFDSFTQADASTSKTFGGTGLGLTISRRLAELMGGSIRVESTQGEGSTFSFTAILLEREQKHQTKPPALSCNGMSAMVVDDNKTNRFYLGTLLSSLGFLVSEADSVESALAMLVAARAEARLPTLLLVDLYMPGGDGWSLLAALKKQDGFDTIRRILMPSVGARGDNERCRKLGVEGYLVKPFVSEEFYELLRRVLVDKPEGQGDRWPVTRHQIQEEQVKLTLLVVDDVEINLLLVRTILERMGHDVVTAGSARDALELMAKQTFDAVFMDVQMPEMDGLQATGIIRDRERSSGGHRTPIIALTAYALAGDRDRCLAAGMDGYVSKPVKPAAIAAALEQHVGVPDKQNRSHAEAIERSEEPIAPATSDLNTLEIPVFDQAELLERLGGNSAMVEKFIGMFKTSTEGFLTALRAAVTLGDIEQVRIHAHTIKGAAANIAGLRMQKSALAIEIKAREGDLHGVAAMVTHLESDFEDFLQAGQGKAQL